MEFRSERVLDSKKFLETAIESEQYVRSFLRTSQDGIYSAELSNASKNNLYVGTAGILHMYVALDQVIPSDEYKHIIKEMTRYLSIHTFDGIEIAKKEGEMVSGMAEAFYSGIGGIGIVLNEVYRFYKYEDAKTGAKKIVDYYLNSAQKADAGIYWSNNSTVFFDGGILLFLIDWLQTYREESICLEKIIIKGAEYILSRGQWYENGGLEIDNIQVDFKHKEPNFEFGTAGIGYLFVKVYEISGDDRFLKAAKATTIYLKSIAVKQDKGYLIPYKLEKYNNLFYLGNCHGPVGTSKLFYELYKVTKEKDFLDDILQLHEGAKSLGAPFKQSEGFWNTTCLCCGPAGYIPFYIGLYKLSKDTIWKTNAYKVGELLVGTRKGISWEIAFDRTNPNLLTKPAGYFTGTAGMVESLLHIYCLENNIELSNGLIDNPYI